MYIEDVAEFARVLLTTTDMTFTCGWPRIELLLFCQLASITGSRPQSLLDLRYRHLQLNLIRDPDGGRPRLFIYLTPEFTKTFLGKKEPYVSPPLPLFRFPLYFLCLLSVLGKRQEKMSPVRKRG